MIRTEHEGRIVTNLASCSDDEVKVIDRFVQRIHNARREYGPLRLKRDTRDFRHEAATEAFDGMFYLCLEDVQRGVSQEPRFAGVDARLLCTHGLPRFEVCNECAAMVSAQQSAERVREALAAGKG